MRILYGVVGDGMGHATRSKVILEHLVAAGHELQIVVSGRAHAFLGRSFPHIPVHEIHGLSMVYEDNRIRKAKTALKLLKNLGGFTDNVESMTRIWEEFRPALCIADFESFAYLFARAQQLPVLSIDNMQIINRCKLDVKLPGDVKGSFRLARSIVKAKLPRCDHYLITTFFFPPIRRKRTSLYPPILREPILEAKKSVTRGEHVLVYQTSDTYADLLPMLGRLPHKFIVYGFKRNEELGNVTLRDFSETGFVTDLKSCRAVLAGGGFSLMGETIYLGKPLLSVPLVGQFEQTLNSLYLEKLGYGEYTRLLDERTIDLFLSREARYAEALASYTQAGNERIFAGLDALIAEIQRKGRLL